MTLVQPEKNPEYIPNMFAFSVIVYYELTILVPIKTPQEIFLYMIRH